MGADLMHIELAMTEENVRKPLVWYILKEGGFVLFMEALNGHNEKCSIQFVNSWEENRVMINGISFHIFEQVIFLGTGLAMKARKW